MMLEESSEIDFQEFWFAIEAEEFVIEKIAIF